jgi:hypothetical protein
MLQNSAACESNHVVTFVWVKLLAGRMFLLYAETNGDRWERGLGCQRDGCHRHRRDFPSPPTRFVSLMSG